MHNLLFCVHTLCMSNVTKTFLLVSSLVSSKQLLCFVHGQGQKREQKPRTKNFVEFHNHSPLLTMLRGTRLVTPKKLRKQLLELAHEGHQGIVKIKQRLRSKVWWPGTDREAEQRCRTCHGCQLVGKPLLPEPMERTELPTQPWQDLAAALLGPVRTPSDRRISAGGC